MHVCYVAGVNKNNSNLITALQGVPIVGHGVGRGPASDISQLSVSPVGPPKLSRRFTKEKPKRRTTVVPRKYMRQLFKTSATRIAAHIMNGAKKKNIDMVSSGVQAGPFVVPPGTAQCEIDLLRYLFMEGVPTTIKPR